MQLVELAPATTIGVKKLELSAVITRADGTVEDLGVIASQDYDTTILKKIGAKICRMFSHTKS